MKRPWPRLLMVAGVWAAAALALSLWARHEWVQAQGMGVWCDQHPDAWPCPWRSFVIQAFLHHRLSTLALASAGCGALGWWWVSRPDDRKASRRFRGAALRLSMLASAVGLVLACGGLVLYDTERSAAAALLSALLLMALSTFEGPSERGRAAS